MTKSKDNEFRYVHYYACMAFVLFVIVQGCASRDTRFLRGDDYHAKIVVSKAAAATTTLTLTGEEKDAKSGNDLRVDDCYHVVLDVGAGAGDGGGDVYGRAPYEPQHHQNSDHTRPITRFWQDEFGTRRDNRDICVLALEADPAHHDRLTALAEAHQARGWRYHFLPWGVSDHEERPADNDDDGQAHVIRLARWMMDHLRHRRLPSRVYGEYHQDNAKEEEKEQGPRSSAPKVVIRMNTGTGTLLRVLPDLLYSGVLCQDVDSVLMHRPQSDDEEFPVDLLTDGSVTIPDVQAANAYVRTLATAMHVSPNCHTRLVQLDDV